MKTFTLRPIPRSVAEAFCAVLLSSLSSALGQLHGIRIRAGRRRKAEAILKLARDAYGSALPASLGRRFVLLSQTPLKVFLLAGVILVVPLPSDAQQRIKATEATDAQFEVIQRRANETEWRRVVAVTNRTGIRWQTNSFIELASGLNRLNPQSGSYEPADPSFTITPEGYAVAEGTQHKIRISPRLNDSDGAVRITTSDGKVIRVSPAALVLANRVSGNVLTIGEFTNTVGQLVSSNAVLFTNVLGAAGFRASLRFLNENGAFHSDVILEERLDTALLQQAGFDPATSEIQIWSAFLEAPPPRIQRRTIYQETNSALRATMYAPDIVNEDLDWGEFKLPIGRAYLWDGQRDVSGSVNVPKRWVQVDGQQYLVETIPLARLEPMFAQMAPPRREMDLGEERLYASDWRPSLRLQQKREEAILMAANTPARPDAPELVLDWVGVNASNPSGYTFQGDRSYLVSGAVSISGTTTIEPGAVIKFNNTASASITINGPVNCLAEPYRPAVFTSKFDNTVGEVIATGTPSSYGGSALYFYLPSSGNVELSNVRFAYANVGVDAGSDQGGTVTLRNVQFVNCTTAVSVGGYYNYPQVNIFNGLIYNSSAAFDVWNGGNVTAQHLTVDTCNTLVAGEELQEYASAFDFKNSIFASVGNLENEEVSLNGQYNGFYPSSGSFGSPYWTAATSPFDAEGAGAHYLASGSAFLDTGTTVGINSQLLTEIGKRTTSAPQTLTTVATPILARGLADTDIPDLGFHYPLLDYLVSGLYISGSSSLNLYGGVAVGVYGDHGIELHHQAQFTSEGTAFSMNRLVWRGNVQELETTGASSCDSFFAIAEPSGSASPLIRARFTEINALPGVALTAGASRLVSSDENYGIDRLELTDCILRGITYDYVAVPYYPGQAVTVAFTNNLFERCHLALYKTYIAQDTVLNVHMRNNTFWRGTVSFTYDPSTEYDNPPWDVMENAFDNVLPISISDSGSYVQRGYNGYVNTTSLGGSGNVSTNSFIYASAFGNRRYQSSSSFLNKGTRTAAEAGLYHHTVLASQAKAGTLGNGKVSIGFHYVATDGNGVPKDNDSDGLHDYVEDCNGNGTHSAGETNWQSSDTDADGVSDGLEVQQGRNALAQGTVSDSGGDVNLRVFTISD